MRQGRRVEKGYEYPGDILLIRAIEDSIRATKNYTEGVKTLRQKHPIQGEDFQSRVFCKYYEVYPDVDLSRTMPFWEAVMTTSDWLWGETRRIDVVFNYDYRNNKASITIEDGVGAIKELANAIPNFSDTLARVITNGGNGSAIQHD